MRDLPLLDSLGVRSKKQGPEKHDRFPYLLGVELELENVNGAIVQDGPPRGWQVHIDDSLRNNGLEYVFSAPYMGEHAIQAVDNFFAIDGNYTGGARTSTHVHVNAAVLTVGALRAIVGLSYILEDALFAALKMYRKWCGYCMPLTEMHQSRLRAILTSDNINSFHAYGIKAAANADKYYGLNVSSLRKHGTLEFRYFPGAPAKEELLSWMDYSTEIVKAGVRLEDVEVLKSLDTPQQLENFLMEVMPLWARRLIDSQGIMPIFDRLNDLQCLMEREFVERVKRADPLIFVSPQLIGLACRIYGTNKASRDAISASLQQLKVMSRQEWEHSIVYNKGVEAAPKKEFGGSKLKIARLADPPQEVVWRNMNEFGAPAPVREAPPPGQAIADYDNAVRQAEVVAAQADVIQRMIVQAERQGNHQRAEEFRAYANRVFQNQP